MSPGRHVSSTGEALHRGSQSWRNDLCELGHATDCIDVCWNEFNMPACLSTELPAIAFQEQGSKSIHMDQIQLEGWPRVYMYVQFL